jgi:putative transposase
MTDNGVPIIEHGLLALSEAEWGLAVRNAALIAPLARQDVVGRRAATDAATQLGVSVRQVYILVERFRRGSGNVTDLLPGQSDGGRGSGRLVKPVEDVIQDLIRTRYLKRQKLSLAALHRDIVQACFVKGLAAPSRSTVARRIAALHPVGVTRRREGTDAARPLQAAGGSPPAVNAPLEQVQIDHTVIDLIVVDEHDRQPVGRPYLTVAIDVFSRCLVGMVLTLEPPSAVSVGICLTHACCDKRPWLESHGIEANWPMSGKPRQLYVDNAAEFKSEALKRGCEQHAIKLAFRPLGRPHYGGIVERVIGTAMTMIHELPGTTFSNTAQRGSYNAEKMASLTLRELERWLILAVAGYHGSVHSGLLQTPATRWSEGIAAAPTAPSVVTNSTAFLVDFLPVIRRTLTRTGFVIDHVHYFANALKPWIARREKLGKFIIRRDPRDISRVWVLDLEGHHYVEVPYRITSHPAVTLWEHRQALERLRRDGRADVDERDLFRMISLRREIAQSAQKTTRKTRRENERRGHLAAAAAVPSALEPPESPSANTDTNRPDVVPFEEIEEW